MLTYSGLVIVGKLRFSDFHFTFLVILLEIQSINRNIYIYIYIYTTMFRKRMLYEIRNNETI